MPWPSGRKVVCYLLVTAQIVRPATHVLCRVCLHAHALRELITTHVVAAAAAVLFSQMGLPVVEAHNDILAGGLYDRPVFLHKPIYIRLFAADRERQKAPRQRKKEREGHPHLHFFPVQGPLRLPDPGSKFRE